MSDGDLAAALDEIRGRGYENGATGVRAERLSDAAAVDVPRLLAALDAVLEAADGCHVMSAIYSHAAGSSTPESWDLDPDVIRERIIRALRGEDSDE